MENIYASASSSLRSTQTKLRHSSASRYQTSQYIFGLCIQRKAGRLWTGETTQQRRELHQDHVTPDFLPLTGATQRGYLHT
jgi:hypothetical protein